MQARHVIAAALSAAAVLAASPAAPADSPFVPDQMIVRFHETPDLAALSEVERVLGLTLEWNTPRHAPHPLGRPGDPHPLSYFRVAHLPPDSDVLGLAPLVTALDSVDYASPNGAPEPADIPNDPLFDMQWSHTKINTPAAWDIATGDLSIIVGIIDTGCLINHEDLQAHIWVNDDPPNGVDDDGNGFVDDTNGWDFVQNDNGVEDVFGHGTQVSGIVGAQIDNGLGVAGIANLTLMQSKWWHTSGSDCSVAESVFYAADNGAHVLNLSLSCGCLLPMTEEAVNYAHANGVVVVASSGNSGGSTPAYPSGYPNVMAISAVDINDQRPGFSNYGTHLDVAAPSPDIYSTGPGGPTSYDPDFRGTSAAAPHVAGLAGFVRSVDPSLTPDEVRDFINDNATDLGAPGFDIQFGNGRIDVGATIAAVSAGLCVADVTGDGFVNVADLLVVLNGWGFCGPTCPGDVDGNSVVNVLDLLIVLNSWGPC